MAARSPLYRLPGRKPLYRVLILLLSLAFLVLGGSSLVRAQIYPDPLPDFAHPLSYHDTNQGANDRLFSPWGGKRDRPMLVIYVQFDDVPVRPGENVEWVRQRFFGPGFPSVAGWYDVNSFGWLTLYPAAEDFEDEGTVDDGVVVVNAGPFASHVDLTTDWKERNRTVLTLADPYVDYSLFDLNADGQITDDELVVVNVRVAREGYVERINGDLCPEPFPNATCPEDHCTDTLCPSWDIGEVANRGVAQPLTLDGVGFAHLNVPMASTASNFITWVHEITHTTLHLVDLYAFPVGTFDIAGPTLDAPDRVFDRDRMLFSACAWSKTHWGWITPTVVTSDGYYDVPLTYTTGAAFILYDPDQGTDDYFMVENRRALLGTYDQNPPDSGLVIWRVDEEMFNPPAGSHGPDGGPITRLSPPNGLAWDPTATPYRTMTSPWRDGTTNTLAVRAIGPPGNDDEIRAYFDVRGPGVLVDPYPLDVGGPYPVVAGATEEIPIPVMNTDDPGEEDDTFVFTLTGPEDWTAALDEVTLAPVEEDTAYVDLTPAHDAPVGIQEIIATGVSATDSSVASSAAMDVEVFHEADLAVLDVTVLDAPAEILAGESYDVTVRTHVTNDGPSWPTDATLELESEADPEGSITPASAAEPVDALELGEVRGLTQTLTVSCDTPGVWTYAVTAEIQPVNDDEDVDPDPENNTASSEMEIECVVPVVINIKPHSYPNSIEPESAGVVAVAVLTTEAGEYGLPLAFDAQAIDPLSVRFGPEGLVWPELGGASEVHDAGHLRDSYELDDATRDRDVDMILHFRTQDTGLQTGDVVACVKGEASDSGGQFYTFFGCDSVRTTSD